MSEELERNPLWLILIETVNALPMYKYHKAYVRYRLLTESPRITPEEVAFRLDIPLGEAIVILYDINKEKSKKDKNGSSNEE